MPTSARRRRRHRIASIVFAAGDGGQAARWASPPHSGRSPRLGDGARTLEPMSYDQPTPEAEEPANTEGASNPDDEQQHHDAETNEDTASGGAPE